MAEYFPSQFQRPNPIMQGLSGSIPQHAGTNKLPLPTLLLPGSRTPWAPNMSSVSPEAEAQAVATLRGLLGGGPTLGQGPTAQGGQVPTPAAGAEPNLANAAPKEPESATPEELQRIRAAIVHGYPAEDDEAYKKLNREQFYQVQKWGEDYARQMGRGN